MRMSHEKYFQMMIAIEDGWPRIKLSKQLKDTNDPVINWCKQNCTGKYIEVITPQGATFYFKNPADAAWFNLVWA